MKFSKIFKIILLLTGLVLSLLFWKILVNLVVSTNIEVSQGNLYLLAIIFWLELLFLLAIYDLVIIELYSGISYYLSKLGQLAVRTKKVRLALYIIRLNYYLLSLSKLFG
ncbi:hypothetical protein ACFKKH_00340, partial [Streptococcus agalactiae]